MSERKRYKTMEDVKDDKTLEVLKERSLKNKVIAGKLEVIDSKTLAKAAKGLKMLKGLREDAEKKREFFVNPLKDISANIKDHIKNINIFFDRLLEPIIEAEGEIKGKVLDYNLAEQRREDEKRKKIEAKRREIEEAKKEAKEEGEEVSKEVEEEEQKVFDFEKEQKEKDKTDKKEGKSKATMFKGEGITISSRKEYVYEVIDINEVPDGFLLPRKEDSKKIRSAINGKKRVKEIAGLKISVKHDVMTR